MALENKMNKLLDLIVTRELFRNKWKRSEWTYFETTYFTNPFLSLCSERDLAKAAMYERKKEN